MAMRRLGSLVRPQMIRGLRLSTWTKTIAIRCRAKAAGKHAVVLGGLPRARAAVVGRRARRTMCAALSYEKWENFDDNSDDEIVACQPCDGEDARSRALSASRAPTRTLPQLKKKGALAQSTKAPLAPTAPQLKQRQHHVVDVVVDLN